MSKNVELVRKYFKAFFENDLAALDSLLSDDLIWHQPGKGALSGDFKGKKAVYAHLGDFAGLSKGTLAIDLDYIAENKDLVAAAVGFRVSSENDSIGMKGVDLFRIEAGKIEEVWLFSEDIEAEDRFWNSLVKK